MCAGIIKYLVTLLESGDLPMSGWKITRQSLVMTSVAGLIPSQLFYVTNCYGVHLFVDIGKMTVAFRANSHTNALLASPTGSQKVFPPMYDFSMTVFNDEIKVGESDEPHVEQLEKRGKSHQHWKQGQEYQ